MYRCPRCGHENAVRKEERGLTVFSCIAGACGFTERHSSPEELECRWIGGVVLFKPGSKQNNFIASKSLGLALNSFLSAAGKCV